MLYELINPSDPYVFEADDLETAALTVFSVSTRYGASSENGEEEIPVFIFGGATEWYTETFGRTPDEGLTAKKVQVAAALDSMMLGKFADRKRYDVALNAITDPEKLEEFKRIWQDDRSSLNGIGTYCHALAKKLTENSHIRESRA